MALKTNYKDAVFSGERKYQEIFNPDGTKSFTDRTTYTTQGDRFGANDINATNSAVNALKEVRYALLDVSKWSNTAPYTQEVDVSGILSTDTPIVALHLSGTESSEAVRALNKQFSKVDFVETLDGKIRVKCFNKKPEFSFYIALKGV